MSGGVSPEFWLNLATTVIMGFGTLALAAVKSEMARLEERIKETHQRLDFIQSKVFK